MTRFPPQLRGQGLGLGVIALQPLKEGQLRTFPSLQQLDRTRVLHFHSSLTVCRVLCVVRAVPQCA